MSKLLMAPAVAFTFLVGACTNVDVEPGKGPITLSSSAKEGFQKYLNTETPKVFVVTEDGRFYHYYYCPADVCRQNNYTHNSIQKCEERAGGRDCKIYALGRTIVWEN